MENKLTAKIRIHLFKNDKCFGPGICSLLEEVDKCGSLRKAAMDMNMSYSKAWKIVKQCEENLGFKLLISTTGGKSGGGAFLTDDAKQIINSYNMYCADIEDYSSKLLDKYF